MNQFTSPHAKQSGFSLLELIVVVAIIALLSMGAIVVYDGLTDKAQATISTSNAVGLNVALREYKTVTLEMPNKWDVIVTAAGTAPAILDATTTQAKFAFFTVTGATAGVTTNLNTALTSVGITSVMVRATAPSATGVEPADMFNAGTTGTTATALSAVVDWSVLPTFGSAACSYGTVAMATTKLDTTTAIAAADGTRQNAIYGDLATNKCNIVLALGFGREAARSTAGKSIEITTSALYTSSSINPAKKYARYIALLHVAQDGYTRPGATAGTLADDIEDMEVFTKPKLLTVLDPEGKTIEENITAQNKL